MIKLQVRDFKPKTIIGQVSTGLMFALPLDYDDMLIRQIVIMIEQLVSGQVQLESSNSGDNDGLDNF